MNKPIDFIAAPFTTTCVLVVCGFYQLHPIGALPLFPEQNPHEGNDLAPSPWSVFDFMELTQIMRQSNDTAVASLLNKIYTGTPEPNSVEDHILQSREISVPEDDPAYSHDVLHIYATNKYAAERNRKMLNRCSQHLYTVTAKDTIKEQNTKLFDITIRLNSVHE